MVKFSDSIFAGETLKAGFSYATATAISAIFVGPEKHSLSFTRTGDQWDLSTDTAAWPAGRYAWQLWIETPGGKSVCGTGRLTVTASLADAEAGADNRTIAERNIEAIQTMLGGKAEKGVRRYRINNRELESYSIEELLKLLDYWKGIRRAERPRRRRGPNILFSI